MMNAEKLILNTFLFLPPCSFKLLFN